MARPKGSKDSHPRRTAARKVAEAAAAKGIRPLDLMLLIMHRRWERDDEDGALQAAEKAAPYVHSKLAGTTLKGNRESPVTIEPTFVIEHRQRFEDWFAERTLLEAAKSGDPIGYLRDYREQRRRRRELLQELRAKRPQAERFNPEARLADWNEANRLLKAEIGPADGE